MFHFSAFKDVPGCCIIRFWFVLFHVTYLRIRCFIVSFIPVAFFCGAFFCFGACFTSLYIIRPVTLEKVFVRPGALLFL